MATDARAPAQVCPGGEEERPAPLGRKMSVRRRLESALRVVRTVLGAPDYQRYLEHVRERHPGEPPLTCEEFHLERLSARYTRPGSRCC